MDAAFGYATLLIGQSITIMPSSATDHWIIHNVIIPFGATCEVYQTNGVYSVLAMTTSTSLMSYSLHCTTSHYYTIKNVGTSTITVSYDGVIT